MSIARHWNDLGDEVKSKIKAVSAGSLIGAICLGSGVHDIYSRATKKSAFDNAGEKAILHIENDHIDHSFGGISAISETLKLEIPVSAFGKLHKTIDASGKPALTGQQEFKDSVIAKPLIIKVNGSKLFIDKTNVDQLLEVLTKKLDKITVEKARDTSWQAKLQTARDEQNKAFLR